MLLSFLFDIPIFLPLLGLFLIWLSSQKEGKFKIAWILVVFATVVAAGFCLHFNQPFLLNLLLCSFLIAILVYRLTHHFLWTFAPFTLAIFWIISGGLYYDMWGEGGNHFMWYSWLDKIGIFSGTSIPTPTYKNPFGFWHLFGLFLFLIYPPVLLVMGRLYLKFFIWLKGIFFGHIKGQSGLWGLLTNK